MANSPLTFYPHLHTRLTGLIKRQADGRGVAPLTLRLKKNGAEVPGDAKTLDVHLAGPGDVGGLQPGSILLMAPPPLRATRKPPSWCTPISAPPTCHGATRQTAAPRDARGWPCSSGLRTSSRWPAAC